MLIFKFGFISSGNYIYVSKDMRIRGYFSETKSGPWASIFVKNCVGLTEQCYRRLACQGGYIVGSTSRNQWTDINGTSHSLLYHTAVHGSTCRTQRTDSSDTSHTLLYHIAVHRTTHPVRPHQAAAEGNGLCRCRDVLHVPQCQVRFTQLRGTGELVLVVSCHFQTPLLPNHKSIAWVFDRIQWLQLLPS